MGYLSLNNQVPALFAPALGLYHLLPLHMPITLFMMDAPFGRFSQKVSRWNVNGNVSWFLMEIVAPITLVLTLKNQNNRLGNNSSILAGLYVTHYFHRAIMSPLILSPKRSSTALIVPILAGIYNLLNAYCLANGLLYYSAPKSPRFMVYILGWALGFIGNVYHDEILNDLRRDAPDQLVSSPNKEEMEKDKKAGNGRYAIPRGGLFNLVSFPNYLCEWFEWTCFALAAAPQPFINLPIDQSYSSLPVWLAGLVDKSPWKPTTLLHPAWMFVVFELASMLPRAIRGHQWYFDTFQGRYPKSRKAVIPWLL